MNLNDGPTVMEIRHSRFWNNTITGHGAELAAGGSGCCSEAAVIKVSNAASQDVTVGTEVRYAASLHIQLQQMVGLRAFCRVGDTKMISSDKITRDAKRRLAFV